MALLVGILGLIGRQLCFIGRVNVVRVILFILVLPESLLNAGIDFVHTVKNGLIFFILELREFFKDIHLILISVVIDVNSLISPQIRQFAFQDHFQFPDFFFIFPQECIFGIFIDDGFVLDKFGSAGVSQCAESLFVVVVRR